MSEVINKTITLNNVTPHPRNYNTHDDAQLGDLRASLKRFGQVRSIVVQARADGLGFLLVAGHGLSQAAQLEGMTTLRADVIPADWSDVKVLAYLAADNELARRGNPDEMQLAAIVAEVAAADEELARLAAGAAERLSELIGGGSDKDGEPLGENGFEYESKYAVTVECEDEQAQKEAYETLTAMGYKCRVVVV